MRGGGGPRALAPSWVLDGRALPSSSSSDVIDLERKVSAVVGARLGGGGAGEAGNWGEGPAGVGTPCAGSATAAVGMGIPPWRDPTVQCPAVLLGPLSREPLHVLS